MFILLTLDFFNRDKIIKNKNKIIKFVKCVENNKIVSI